MMIRLHNDDWGFETNCFVCEPTNTNGLQIPFFHDTDRGVVRAEATASFTTLGEAQAVRIAGGDIDDRHRHFVND